MAAGVQGKASGEAMTRHLLYWWARVRNDFLRLCWFGPTEHQFVEEVMAGLRRDKLIAQLLDEAEAVKTKEDGE
jgi:hypothetical protein